MFTLVSNQQPWLKTMATIVFELLGSNYSATPRHINIVSLKIIRHVNLNYFSCGGKCTNKHNRAHNYNNNYYNNNTKSKWKKEKTSKCKRKFECRWK